MPTFCLRAALAAASAEGVSLIADTSEAIAAAEREELLALVPGFDVFAPSREETRLLLPGLTDTQAAHCLAERGPRILQKRGGSGILFIDGPGGEAIEVAAPSVPVVDPTGAGDAMVGAIAAGRASGFSWRETIASGLSIGSRAVTSLGPHALGLSLPFVV
jgi:sugar/nucleoside kinase (ribokinase family)